MICIYVYRKPGYNWDILPYMGVVLHYENAKEVHRTVYAIAKEEFPENVFKQLTDSTNRYRFNVYHHQEEYNLQMPFYVVKPLYTGMAYLFYKAGFPLSRATVLPSLIAYFLTAVLLFYWLSRYLPVIFATIAGLLISLWGPLLMVAGMSAPDALSAMLLFFAFYFFIEKDSILLPYIFLLLSILARIDNILPVSFIIAIIVYTKNQRWNRKFKKGALLLSGAFVCFFLVSSLASEYGWSLLYYSDFYKHLNTSYDVHTLFSFSNYWSLFKSQLMTGLYYSHLPLFFFLSMIIIRYGYIAQRKLNTDILLTVTFLLVIVIRFVLQPVIADRLYIPYYLVILILLIRLPLRKHSHQV